MPAVPWSALSRLEAQLLRFKMVWASLNPISILSSFRGHRADIPIGEGPGGIAGQGRCRYPPRSCASDDRRLREPGPRHLRGR